MHRVVVVGGGFAGINVVKQLRRQPVEVTLVDRRNFHLFQPLLYQVATGSLSPGEIAAPLRAVFRRDPHVTVLMAEVVDIDAAGRKVILDSGELPYDTLVMAAGSRNHYFGHDEWHQYAPGLKTVEDATDIRHKILYAFEAAEREMDPEKRRAWLTFLVVGAGPTGVELAGALGEIANDTLRDEFRSIRPEEARILILDGSPRVLPPYAPSLSAAAERHLIELGVRTRNKVKVIEVDAEGVDLESAAGPERIAARTVLWAAGVAASVLGQRIAASTGAELDHQGRVKVQPDLSVSGHPEILVAGDLAHIEQDGKALPGVAPVAMQQGNYAGKLIRARLRGGTLEPFRYFDKGSMAVIGRAAAVAEIGPLKLHGLLAWLAWLFVHLMYIVQFQNRVVVFIKWGFEYLSYNRGARLITGSPGEGTPAAPKEQAGQMTVPR